MKTKKILGVVAAAMLVGAAAGCAPTSEPSTPTTDPTSNPTTSDPTTTDPSSTGPVEGGHIKEEVKITFWNTKGEPYSSVINNAIESFKQIEPNVTVENVKQSVGISGLTDVVTKGFTSNVYPDIVEGYPDAVSTYLDYEKVVELDQYINDPAIGWTAEEKADVVPAYLEEGQQYLVDGTYSLPFSKSTEILLYNKTLLNGIDLSGIDPTINEGYPLDDRYFKHMNWDEFFNKLCPALMTFNDSLPADEKLLDTTLPNYAILGYDSDDNLAITLTQQYGLPYTRLDRDNYKGEALFNTPEMVDKIEWIKDMAAKKYIMTQGGLGTYTNSLLSTNGVLFMVGSTGGLSHCVVPGIELGAAYNLSPAEGQGELKIVSQGPSICILEHTGDDSELRKQAAWLFYKHLTNYENGLAWSLNGGYSPIRYSVMNDPAYIAAMDPENAGSTDSLNHLLATVNTVIAEEDFANALFTTPAFKGSAQARTNFGGVISQAVGGVMQGQTVTRAQIEEWLEEAWNNTVLEINK